MAVPPSSEVRLRLERLECADGLSPGGSPLGAAVNRAACALNSSLLFSLTARSTLAFAVSV